MIFKEFIETSKKIPKLQYLQGKITKKQFTKNKYTYKKQLSILLIKEVQIKTKRTFLCLWHKQIIEGILPQVSTQARRMYKDNTLRKILQEYVWHAVPMLIFFDPELTESFIQQIFIMCRLYAIYCDFNSGKNLLDGNNWKVRKKLDEESCSVHYYLELNKQTNWQQPKCAGWGEFRSWKVVSQSHNM